MLESVSKSPGVMYGHPYRNLLGHLPIVISADAVVTSYFLPLIFSPLTTVPVLVFKSSIVSVDRCLGLCDRPSSTLSTVIVKCFREIVLCEIASWPAVSGMLAV